jgi:hypothetical protein
LTEKVLWNFEPNYQQKLECVEKNKKFLQAWSSRGSFFFFFWVGQELARHYAVQFPFGLCWGFWPCLPPSFFGLSCWGLNKDSRPVGRTFTKGIFKCLLE